MAEAQREHSKARAMQHREAASRRPAIQLPSTVLPANLAHLRPRADAPDAAQQMRDMSAAVADFRGRQEAQLSAAVGRVDALEARLNRIGLGQGEMPDAVGLSVDPSAQTVERRALATFARTGSETDLRASMRVGSDPDGGYMVHPQRSTVMQRRLLDLSPMRRLARIETLNTGDAWEEPLDLDASGAEWVGETAGRSETGTPQIGVLSVPLKEIFALQKITQRLLDDSAVDLGGWLEGKIADRFGDKEGAAFVAGDGILSPRGVVDYPTATTADATRPVGTLQHIVSGDANGFGADTAGADKLRDLMWTLRGPYRQDGAVWLMNSATANIIDKFKDGAGNHIWRPGQVAGAPSSLLGYPVEIDENMPDVAAGALPIAFGNFKRGYLIVDRPGLKVLRDPYTSKPNVLFYAYRRVGGGVANSEAIKLLKISA